MKKDIKIRKNSKNKPNLSHHDQSYNNLYKQPTLLGNNECEKIKRLFEEIKIAE